jgi:3-isopropylmalate dehydratase large subunit
MGMTITEKILAKASGRETVAPNEIVIAKVDVACVDDVQFFAFYEAFKRIAKNVWDREKAVLIMDHYQPPSAVEQAEIIKAAAKFAEEYELRHYYFGDGIKNQVFSMHGIVRPGIVLVATDSHTNTSGAFGAFAVALGPTEMAAVFKTGEIWFRVPQTIKLELKGNLQPMVTPKDVMLHILGNYGTDMASYKAVEFAGPFTRELGVDGRVVLCNMSTEMGAKNGIVEPNEEIVKYVKERAYKTFEVLKSDSDATYVKTCEVNVSELEPLVAAPYSPANVKAVSVVEGTEIDQAFIGTCTGGNLEDLRIAARILRGRKVRPYVRAIMIPASREVLTQASREGLIEVFNEAGFIVCNPNCGPCAGMHQGTAGAEDIVISAQSRNFRGRSGSPHSKTYLASPATVAASALEGKISDPRKFLGGA